MSWHIVAEDEEAGQRVELEIAFATREEAEHHCKIMHQWMPPRFRVVVEERRNERETLH